MDRRASCAQELEVSKGGLGAGRTLLNNADSDEVARAFRDDAARGFRYDVAQGAGLAGCEVVPLLVVDGQSFLAALSRVRRRLSPVRSMRWALWLMRARIESA